MTLDAYSNPDFTLDKKLIFLVLAFIGLIIGVVLIIIGNKISTSSLDDEERDYEFPTRTHNRVQRFYEMMISAFSVMSFACSYVIINHIYTLIQEGADPGRFAPLVGLWENGRDFILLLLICLSCVLNTLLDKFIIPLKDIDKDEKASIRMLGMFYVIIILLYLNVIGDESEYSPVMMYYLGLMVGRFVYFDASFIDFLTALKNAFKNFPLLVMGLVLTAALSFFGFNAGYLLERNYYIVGVFYTLSFIIVAIFILHHSHILHLIVRKPNNESDYEDDDLDGENYLDEEDDPTRKKDPDGDYEEYDIGRPKRKRRPKRRVRRKRPVDDEYEIGTAGGTYTTEPQADNFTKSPATADNDYPQVQNVPANDTAESFANGLTDVPAYMFDSDSARLQKETEEARIKLESLGQIHPVMRDEDFDFSREIGFDDETDYDDINSPEYPEPTSTGSANDSTNYYAPDDIAGFENYEALDDDFRFDDQ